MTAVGSQGPMKSKRLNFGEIVRRWDWLLVLLIAPVMLFPDSKQAWALIALPIVMVIQGLAWGEILPVTPLNPAILLLAIMTGVSIFVTPDLESSLGKIAGMLFGMAVYFCAARHTRTKPGWKGSLTLFIIAGTGIALLGLAGTNWVTAKYPGLNTLTALLPVRLAGLPGAETGIHPNELAGALLWVIPIIFLAGFALVGEKAWFSNNTDKLFIHPGKFPSWLVFIIIAFVIEVSVLILSQARGGYLALALTGLLLIVLIPRRSKGWWAIGLLAVIAIGGGILIQKNGWRTLQSEVLGNEGAKVSAFSQSSLSMRGEIWSHAIWAIQDVPLTGLGMNVFRSAVYTLYPTLAFSTSYADGHAHNEILQAALDLGLPCLVGFLALYVGALAMLLRPIKAGGTWRLLALGVLGGLLAHFLFGITDAVALGAKPGFLFWWLMAMAFGLYHQNRSPKAVING
jgi:putative inorganic carbon (hco3(-)) transporter